MPFLSYTQIVNALSERNREVARTEKTTREFVKQLIAQLKCEPLDIPTEAITCYRYQNQAYIAVERIEEIRISSEGFFLCGLGIEFASPADANTRHEVLLKLKIVVTGEAVVVSIQGTAIQGRLRGLNDREGFIKFFKGIAELLSNIFTKDFDAALLGGVDMEHPAYEAMEQIINDYILDQESPQIAEFDKRG